jgi:3-oxoacyl-[acyl-carrier-protein] synthase-3
MAAAKIRNISIRGISSTVPRKIVSNADFLDQYSEQEISKICNMSGVVERRYVDDDTCTSDLATFAALDLLGGLGWDPSSIDALIFVSQTPDYRLPPSSCLIQHSLGLSKHCASLDISMGCSGYVYGLWLASSIIASGGARRVLLLVGDTCTKFVSKGDKSTCFLFGDAGSATGIEFDLEAGETVFSMGTDGVGAKNLIIPAGGYRTKSSPATVSASPQVDGGFRALEDLYMNGAEIFNFTISEVPKLVQATLQEAGLRPESIAHFVFHQANEFMIKHIAKKLKLSLDKVPLSIHKYGNTSSASIPLTICSELKMPTEHPILMAGFGVGYSWAACTANLAKNALIRLTEYQKS